MPVPNSPDFLLVTIALASQAMVACLTSLMLWGYRRHYTHRYSAYWALGWGAAAWAYGLQTASYLLTNAPASGAIRIALTWSSLTAAYWQCVLFVVAAVSMAHQREVLPRRWLIALLAAVPLVTLALTLPFAFDVGAGQERYLLRFVARSVVFGVAFLSAAWAVSRAIATDAPVAHRALVGALAGLGVVELMYAVPTVLTWFTGTPRAAFPALSLFELGSLLALSIAMHAWFHERDRSTAVQQRLLLEEATGALQRRDEQFRAIMECAPYGILWKDLTGRITMANDSAAEILGQSTGTALEGRQKQDFLTTEVAAKLRAADVAAIELGECETEFEIRRGGVTRTISTQRFPVRDDVGAAVGLCVIMSDVTDRRQSEAQYYQSQKLESIGRLAGGVAHDFNNLLTAILAHVEFAETSTELENEVREDLGQIRVAAERAAGLTGQLLAFARHHAIEPETMDLSSHVSGMGHMLRRLIGERIECTIDVTDEAWFVRADHGQIEQALVNLVLNAKDAMPNGGRLLIHTHNVRVHEQSTLAHRGLVPGDYHALQVSDTGTGMTEEVKTRIFEPFFSTKPAGRGTGLGLATVYGIVVQSGGQILVDSAVNAGTTFSIYLPRALGDEPAMQPTRVPDAMQGGHGELVLVVEDDAEVRDVVARTLSGAGYRVITAENGEAAIERAHGEGPDIAVLVSDVVMPKIGGVDLVRRLSVSHPEMRVLLTTGYSGEELGVASFIDERSDVLTKPFTPADLLRRVGQVLAAAECDAPTTARITAEFAAITRAR